MQASPLPQVTFDWQKIFEPPAQDRVEAPPTTVTAFVPPATDSTPVLYSAPWLPQRLWQEALPPPEWPVPKQLLPAGDDDAATNPSPWDRVRIPWLPPRPADPHAPSTGRESPFDSPFRTPWGER